MLPHSRLSRSRIWTAVLAFVTVKKVTVATQPIRNVSAGLVCLSRTTKQQAKDRRVDGKCRVRGEAVHMRNCGERVRSARPKNRRFYGGSHPRAIPPLRARLSTN